MKSDFQTVQWTFAGLVVGTTLRHVCHRYLKWSNVRSNVVLTICPAIGFCASCVFSCVSGKSRISGHQGSGVQGGQGGTRPQPISRNYAVEAIQKIRGNGTQEYRNQITEAVEACAILFNLHNVMVTWKTVEEDLEKLSDDEIVFELSTQQRSDSWTKARIAQCGGKKEEILKQLLRSVTTLRCKKPEMSPEWALYYLHTLTETREKFPQWDVTLDKGSVEIRNELGHVTAITCASDAFSFAGKFFDGVPINDDQSRPLKREVTVQSVIEGGLAALEGEVTGVVRAGRAMEVGPQKYADKVIETVCGRNTRYPHIKNGLEECRALLDELQIVAEWRVPNPRDLSRLNKDEVALTFTSEKLPEKEPIQWTKKEVLVSEEAQNIQRHWLQYDLLKLQSATTKELTIQLLQLCMLADRQWTIVDGTSEQEIVIQNAGGHRVKIAISEDGQTYTFSGTRSTGNPILQTKSSEFFRGIEYKFEMPVVAIRTKGIGELSTPIHQAFVYARTIT